MGTDGVLAAAALVSFTTATGVAALGAEAREGAAIAGGGTMLSSVGVPNTL